jgi:hypothetical protein
MDFAPLGWNTNQNPYDSNPEPHCCPGCHLEAEERITAWERFLAAPGFQPGRWSRSEARVCCALSRWLDEHGYLGEDFLTKAGDVTFHGETRAVPDVRVYLATRTIDRNILARLIRVARARERAS